MAPRPTAMLSQTSTTSWSSSTDRYGYTQMTYFNPSGFKSFFLVSVIFIVSFLLNDIFSGIAMWRMPKPAYGWPRRPELPNPVLPDLGFDLLPDYCAPSNLPTIFLLFLMGSTALRFLVFDSRRLTIFCRFFLCDSVLLLFRSVTIVATALNNPSPACDNCGQEECPSTLGGCVLLTLSKFPFFSCGDLMFSGHTVHFLLCALTWQYYSTLLNSERPILRRLLSTVLWLVTICGICTLLMCKFHYSIDVLIAFSLTLFIWVRYHTVAFRIQDEFQHADSCWTKATPRSHNRKSFIVRFIKWFEGNLYH